MVGKATAVRIEVAECDLAGHPRVEHLERRVELADAGVPGDESLTDECGDDGRANGFGNGGELEDGVGVDESRLADLANAKSLGEDDFVLKDDGNREAGDAVFFHFRFDPTLEFRGRFFDLRERRRIGSELRRDEDEGGEDEVMISHAWDQLIRTRRLPGSCLVSFRILLGICFWLWALRTAVRRSQLLALALASIRRERSFPDLFTKNYIGSGFFWSSPGWRQEYSRTKVRSSSDWISGACHAGLWSKPSGKGGGHSYRRILAGLVEREELEGPALPIDI